MKKHFAVSIGFAVIMALFLIPALCQPVLADVLNLPVDLEEIGDEAFCGDASLDEVVLPEGITTI